MDNTFSNPTLFKRQHQSTMVRLLAQHAMTAPPAVWPNPKVFEDNLEAYAEKAGITIEQARNNVCLEAHTLFNHALQSYRVDVV